MAEVKWIKITTDMFDNRKIKYIRRLPEGDSIVLIWVMLLTMAGRCNDGGRIWLTETIPYNDKSLANELGFEESTVILAMDALENLYMIDRSNEGLTIPGWEEYQNIEGMEKIRESKRLAQARWRAKQKTLALESTVESHVDSTEIESGNADKEREKEERIRSSSIEEEAVTRAEIHEQEKRAYGKYVRLTMQEFGQLLNRFGCTETGRRIKAVDFQENAGKDFYHLILRADDG